VRSSAELLNSLPDRCGQPPSHIDRCQGLPRPTGAARRAAALTPAVRGLNRTGRPHAIWPTAERPARWR